MLDDNKVLTLANGDRILMTPTMKAMFEPENLANASPATVSRAGIIYVPDSELGWGPVAESWLQVRAAGHEGGLWRRAKASHAGLGVSPWQRTDAWLQHIPGTDLRDGFSRPADSHRSRGGSAAPVL